jgi:hypothetical protein
VSDRASRTIHPNSWDCLARDSDGAAVLVYDNHKRVRRGNGDHTSGSPCPGEVPARHGNRATCTAARPTGADLGRFGLRMQNA